jgi:hypothetical protein
MLTVIDEAVVKVVIFEAAALAHGSEPVGIAVRADTGRRHSIGMKHNHAVPRYFHLPFFGVDQRYALEIPLHVNVICDHLPSRTAIV